MCGIAGTVNWGDQGTISRMISVQVHRGPDDGGVWEHRAPDGTYVALGSRRLSIIDLSSAGHMPMSSEDGKLWITYNGEVYNFRELREELLAKGHQFKSRTDTEVVLHLYESEGPECVRRLNGMFAIAIADLRGSSPEVFLVRDRLGVKPLYYVQQGNRLAFASEIKSLLQLQGLEREIDYAALHKYLTFLWVPDPATLFRGVLKLPAGHYATFRNGQFKMKQYWDLGFPAADARMTRSEDDLTVELLERLRVAVQRQLVADVPVGVFLSSGLDSSTIAAIISEQGTRPIGSYTITFPDRYRVGENTLDNPKVASRFAQRLGFEHHEIVVDADAAQLLPKLIWHMDEPIADPALITAYLVCREASRGLKVMLSGIGGDELFAGYRKHYAHRWANSYRRLPGFVRGAFQEGVEWLPTMRGTPVKGFLRLAKKMARSGSLPAEDAFLANSTYLNSQELDELCLQGLRREMEKTDPWSQHRDYFARVPEADFLNRMLYLDTKAFMVSLNLTYNDKMSMASSVEVRVPFLDHELVEFAAREIPPDLKLRGFFRPKTKYILRKTMADRLAPEILKQPKAGFGAPIDYWLARELGPMVDDLLSEQTIIKRGLFRPEAVRNIISEHRRNVRDWSMQILQLLTLELWTQQFLDTVERPISEPLVSAS